MPRTHTITVYLDCKDAYQKYQTTSGIYTINPDNQTAFQVYCDMDTDGGGWIIIQRRMNSTANFNQSWNEYEAGFGNLTGEYWLGLTYIQRLTASAAQQIRVDIDSHWERGWYSRKTANMKVRRIW